MAPPARSRWNGWGSENVAAELPATVGALLEQIVGPGTPPRDSTLAAVLAGVRPARIDGDAGLSVDGEDRLRHARGQSLPDWIALRSGRVPAVPDAVARPSSAAEVRQLLERARAGGWTLVPYGGGTSVVGGVTVEPSSRPVVSVDLAETAGLRADLDLRSSLATLGAGTRGPAVEAVLGEHGLTLGHFPQSFELSTLGGWVAARSVGQESMGFGRIEAMFAGGHVETPSGPLDLPPHPASAAGPDLRELVLGSEGRIGIITDVIVRAVPRPARELQRAYSLPDWDRALEAGRTLARSGLPLRMVRVATAVETASTVALIPSDRSRTWLARYLGWRRHGTDACLVLVGFAGSDATVRATEGEVARVIRSSRGIGLPGVGSAWRRTRFHAPYLRNALWDAGYAVDTVETAAPWAVVPDLIDGLDTALRRGLDPIGEGVHAFSHLSHLYSSGSSLYTTYIFRVAPDPAETLDRWRTLKRAASETIVAHGGTITHQHGIGRDHAPYLAAEKGPLGMEVLGTIVRRFDPDRIMHPGILLEDGAP
jgi:alkyldihydroxyacetonephosphate synthase